MKRLLLLPGDGVGAELMIQAQRVLQRLIELGLPIAIDQARIGGQAIDHDGQAFPPATRDAVARADAVLLGAVGGQAWDELPIDQRPESALLALRKSMAVFANLRPLLIHPSLIDQSPVKAERLVGVDILVVRELIGGIYFSEPRGQEIRAGQQYAYNTMAYGQDEVERVARLAFDLARERSGRLTSVDKANVLEVSRLWRQVVNDCSADYPEVKLNHLYVDNAAMQMILQPAQFDVVLTSNLFGDILSDLGAAMVGSIGLLPSASLNARGRGLFEPVHGSAPELLGQNQANPLALLYSLSMLLRHCQISPQAADGLDRVIGSVLAEGYRTADICAQDNKLVSTSAMIDLICARL